MPRRFGPGPRARPSRPFSEADGLGVWLRLARAAPQEAIGHAVGLVQAGKRELKLGEDEMANHAEWYPVAVVGLLRLALPSCSPSKARRKCWSSVEPSALERHHGGELGASTKSFRRFVLRRLDNLLPKRSWSLLGLDLVRWMPQAVDQTLTGDQPVDASMCRPVLEDLECDVQRRALVARGGPGDDDEQLRALLRVSSVPPVGRATAHVGEHGQELAEDRHRVCQGDGVIAGGSLPQTPW